VKKTGGWESKDMSKQSCNPPYLPGDFEKKKGGSNTFWGRITFSVMKGKDSLRRTGRMSVPELRTTLISRKLLRGGKKTAALILNVQGGRGAKTIPAGGNRTVQAEGEKDPLGPPSGSVLGA